MGFGFAVAADHHDQLLGADIQAANIGVVHVVLLGLGWFRLPDPASSPVELVYAGCRANDASDSPRPWRRGRGAYLKPRLPIEDRASPLIGLPRNMGALCPMPLYHKYNIQAILRWNLNGSRPPRGLLLLTSSVCSPTGWGSAKCLDRHLGGLSPGSGPRSRRTAAQDRRPDRTGARAGIDRRSSDLPSPI
jgi:hypothetical protein